MRTRRLLQKRRAPAEIRFWEKVLVVDSCWEWIGARTGRQGYAVFWAGGKIVIGHRYAYELRKGPIPEGLTLDHLCRNRGCVNPDHLEPVTIRENLLRGFSPVAINHTKTHCKHGHRLDVHARDDMQPNGHVHRRCRACVNRNTKAYRARMAQTERQWNDSPKPTRSH